jgi:hypothetical protein
MNAKVYKIILQVTAVGDYQSDEEIRYMLENVRNLYPTIITMESRDLGEWYDDHPLNKKETNLAEFERLFNGNNQE